MGRYRDTGTVYGMRLSGRSKAATVVNDCYLRISARMNPESNATVPKNTLNGLVRIGIKFYSQMSVPYAFNQTTVGDMFGGNLVRLNILDTLSSEWSKVVVP